MLRWAPLNFCRAMNCWSTPMPWNRTCTQTFQWACRSFRRSQGRRIWVKSDRTWYPTFSRPKKLLQLLVGLPPHHQVFASAFSIWPHIRKMPKTWLDTSKFSECLKYSMEEASLYMTALSIETCSTGQLMTTTWPSIHTVIMSWPSISPMAFSWEQKRPRTSWTKRRRTTNLDWEWTL